MANQTSAFDEWAIVDLFGHQRFAGRVRIAEFPPDFLRLDVPATPGFDPLTQLISPKAVYALTPTTQAIATAVAANCRPEPVRRWELPAAPAESDQNRDEWTAEGHTRAIGPDPDYGKDLDNEDEEDEEPF